MKIGYSACVKHRREIVRQETRRRFTALTWHKSAPADFGSAGVDGGGEIGGTDTSRGDPVTSAVTRVTFHEPVVRTTTRSPSASARDTATGTGVTTWAHA
ncbi:hypothetical protein GCM10010171_52610 [Actinokineospora fastidiosa]|uniref:Uncharacterized protein n=1 Tax=Actinokineospora fastidiosa TaxID=1816 RepID=A0A918LI32_9PSEU|nr:hypothetical protein GCM10010171_52610 [Actinokineospora fastidiosa]